MHPIMRLTVAAIVVVAVVGLGINLLGSGLGPGAGPIATPAPTPTPTAAPPSATPSARPSPSPIDTATWKRYVSSRYGFSIGRPADWTERPADHDWTLAADSDWMSTASEGFRAPSSTILVTAWSVAVERGTSADAWIQDYCARSAAPCTGLQDRTTGATIDGHAGSLVQFADDTQAFALVDGRMYVVAVWEPDSDPRAASYGGAVSLLRAFLSTMRLLPGGPVPAATTALPS